MKKEKQTGSIKDFKYNSFIYLKKIASSVREVLKSRFLNNCGKQKMNKEEEKGICFSQPSALCPSAPEIL